jgi:hypothetical protein
MAQGEVEVVVVVATRNFKVYGKGSLKPEQTSQPTNKYISPPWNTWRRSGHHPRHLQLSPDALIILWSCGFGHHDRIRVLPVDCRRHLLVSRSRLEVIPAGREWFGSFMGRITTAYGKRKNGTAIHPMRRQAGPTPVADKF